MSEHSDQPRPAAIRAVAGNLMIGIQDSIQQIPKLTTQETAGGIGLALVSLFRDMQSADMPGDLEKFRAMCMDFHLANPPQKHPKRR